MKTCNKEYDIEYAPMIVPNIHLYHTQTIHKTYFIIKLKTIY